MELERLKKLYNLLANDRIRAFALLFAERFNIRKDILRLDTNNMCNIRCIMCSTNKTNKAMIMPLDDFKKIIDRFKNTTRLLYLSCGYEPFVTPKFEQYITYAKSQGVPFISFATNLILLTDDLIKCVVDNQVNEIIVSINGYTKEDYNRIMCRADFEKLINNLQKLNEYKKQKKSKFPSIRINTIIMKSNLLEFDNLIKLVDDFDIDYISFRPFWVYSEQNNPVENENELISHIPADRLQEIIQKILFQVNLFKEKGKSIIIPNSLLAGHAVDCISSNSDKKKSCSIPYFTYIIRHDGSIDICAFDKDARIGNFFTDNFKVLVKNIKLFRKKALKGKCAIEQCTSNTDSSSII